MKKHTYLDIFFDFILFFFHTIFYFKQAVFDAHIDIFVNRIIFVSFCSFHFDIENYQKMHFFPHKTSLYNSSIVSTPTK